MLDCASSLSFNIICWRWAVHLPETQHTPHRNRARQIRNKTAASAGLSENESSLERREDGLGNVHGAPLTFFQRRVLPLLLLVPFAAVAADSDATRGGGDSGDSHAEGRAPLHDGRLPIKARISAFFYLINLLDKFTSASHRIERASEILMQFRP